MVVMSSGRSICDFSNDDDIIRDVGERHYSEVQSHPGGRVSTKVSHGSKLVICTSDDDMVGTMVARAI